MSIIEDLNKDYYVNHRTYFQFLPDLENTIISEEWTHKWVMVDKRIKYLFKFNTFLSKLLFDDNYNNILIKNCFGSYKRYDFAHSQTIRVNEDRCNTSYCDTITGVLSFPYMNWEEVGLWISKCSEDWSVYIMNPALVSYNFGAPGLFLTPNYYNGNNIRLFNNYIIKLTGYPLFLKYTTDDVEPIKKMDLTDILTKENFMKELCSKAEDEAFKRLVEFWGNEGVTCDELDSAYSKYMNAQPYFIYEYSIDFKRIQSLTPFKLLNHDTFEEIGMFKEFRLDKTYNEIITHDGRVSVTDEQLDDLMQGRYHFRFYFKLDEENME